MKERILFLGVVILFIANFSQAQTPVFTADFEGNDTVSTIQGISGKALDLGPQALKRQVLIANTPFIGGEQGFTVTVWTKEDQAAKEAYDVVSNMEKKDTEYVGWKIGTTTQGSWVFMVNAGAHSYEYATTAPRQTVRDGRWHLLAATYSAADNELRFYYDGRLMAVYRADGIQGFYQTRTLVIGGSRDSPHYFARAPYDSFWDSYDGQIDDIRLYGQTLTEQEIADYYQKVSGVHLVRDLVNMPDQFKVTSFNIFHGGHEFGKEVGKNRLIDIIRKTNSDAICMIETYGSGPEIADALGYYIYLISSNLSIITKYPITRTYRLTDSFKGGGAQLAIPGGKKVNLFCIWLDWQPAFHTYGFSNRENWSLDRYMQEENKRRGGDMRTILRDIRPYIAQKDSIPIIVGGDFNSGSHLDWTEETKSIHKGYVIDWPASEQMIHAGFRDSYREIFPDPLKYPGITFSDHYPMWIKARLDYIYYQGNGIKAVDAEIIRKHPVLFPSDHAATSTLFELGRP
jgi:hypothetical protein